MCVWREGVITEQRALTQLKIIDPTGIGKSGNNSEVVYFFGISFRFYEVDGSNSIRRARAYGGNVRPE